MGRHEGGEGHLLRAAAISAARAEVLDFLGMLATVVSTIRGCVISLLEHHHRCASRGRVSAP